MTLTTHQITELLDELDEKQLELLKAKDTKTLANLYDEHAVLIHKGVNSWYGREKIEKVIEGFSNSGDNFSLPKRLHSYGSSDGTLLGHKSTFTVEGKSKEFSVEQIYKKVNGEYKIVYDIFEFDS